MIRTYCTLSASSFFEIYFELLLGPWYLDVCLQHAPVHFTAINLVIAILHAIIQRWRFAWFSSGTSSMVFGALIY
jgi:hypothetical protein